MTWCLVRKSCVHMTFIKPRTAQPGAPPCRFNFLAGGINNNKSIAKKPGRELDKGCKRATKKPFALSLPPGSASLGKVQKGGKKDFENNV